MKRRGTEELQQLKPLSLKIRDTTSKNVWITEKNGKQCVRLTIYSNQGYLPIKSYPCY